MEDDHHFSRLVMFVVIIALVLSVGTAIIALKVQDNADRIGQLEIQDVTTLRKADATTAHLIYLIYQTDYRLCLRGQVTRAAIDLDTRHDEPTLPLYNCTPDSHGGKAVLFTPSQRATFLHYVKTGRNLP